MAACSWYALNSDYFCDNWVVARENIKRFCDQQLDGDVSAKRIFERQIRNFVNMESVERFIATPVFGKIVIRTYRAHLKDRDALDQLLQMGKYKKVVDPVTEAAQIARLEKKEAAKAASYEPPKGLTEEQKVAWRYFEIGKAKKDLKEIRWVVKQILDAASDTPDRRVMRTVVEKATSSTLEEAPGSPTTYGGKDCVYFGGLINNAVFLHAMISAYEFLTKEAGFPDTNQNV